MTGAANRRPNVIRFEPPTVLMSMNDRDHWRTKARKTALWRTAAWATATKAKARSYPPCTVHITFPVRDRRRRDPHNYYPTVKAVIDGLVDAGVWPDDTPEWVTTIEPTLEVGGTHVVITLTERTS